MSDAGAVDSLLIAEKELGSVICIFCTFVLSLGNFGLSDLDTVFLFIPNG